MSTLNKYHSSGRLYTNEERALRRRALSRLYVVLGYSGRKTLGKDGLLIPEAQVRPYIRKEPRRHEGNFRHVR